MTKAQRDILRKRGVLEHAERIGNVCKTCRYFGVSRSVFYLWRKAYETHGDEGLVNKKPCPVNLKLHTPPQIVEKVLYLRLAGDGRWVAGDVGERSPTSPVTRAIMDTIGTRALGEEGDVELDGIDLSPERVRAVRRIYLVACGTACYACMVGKYLLEQIAGIPAEVDLASEFRYRKPILDGSSLVLPVSQSGETADTLAALRQGKAFGARVLSICNVRDATIARESDDVLYTHAGPEIGVASTKAFTTQIVTLYLLALKLGISRGRLGSDGVRQRLLDLMRLPRMVQQTLQLEESIHAIAQKFFHASNFLFLGRGIMYPIALEGALKLKEISYIHAEGYAAGEMKHGPIALIDEDMPVVVIANRSPVYDKVLSNLEQVRSRDGVVIAVASEGDAEIAEKANEVIWIPDLGEYLTSVLAVVPLQLLAYHIAVLKGTDVDQPRNLAKSVTVE